MSQRLENLAFNYTQGEKDFPCLVFLPGFRSDMRGNKAQYLAQQCKKRGQSCLLLDYSGHGASGGKFEEGSIGQWTRDAIAIIDYATSGPLIVVGSSMGGWIALLVALARKDTVVGMVGIAAAPDFTRDIKKRLSDQYKNDLQLQGFFAVSSDYGEDLIVTKHL
ncbi:MAG: alpha/beta hydrolase, partial [Micavibrio aeruginosavorus]